MQTLHHMAYAEFADGIRTGLRAAEVFEREGALWGLCSVQAFVIYQDGTLGSREQATSLADKALGIAERLGHLGAAFMVLLDRVGRQRCSPTSRLWRRSVRRFWTSGAGCHGATWATSTLVWPPTGEAMPNAPRPSSETPSSWSRRVRRGQSVSLLARHLAYQGRAEEVLELFESTRSTLPSLDRASGVGSWNSMFGFVEALYLCGRHEEAAALSPLVEGVLARVEAGSPSTGD